MHTNTKNIVFNTMGETLWGFQAAMVMPATVLTLLLRHFGAGPAMIGAIAAIDAGGLVVPQILGLFMFRGLATRRRDLVIWHYALVIPFLLSMGVVLLAFPGAPQATLRWSLLALFAGFTVSIGVILAVWMDWLALVFPKDRRGSALGLSFGMSALAGCCGGLLAGHLIGHAVSVRICGWLYVCAAACGFVSITMFWFVKTPTENTSAHVTRLDTARLFDRFFHSLRDVNFRAFLVGRLLATAGFCIGPFVALYYTSRAGGGLASGTVVSAGAAQAAGLALGNLGFGRLGDRHGHRICVLAGAGMQAVALVMLLLMPGLAGCVAVYGVTGVCMSAGFASHYNMMFETCPHDNRMAHIVAGNLVMSLGAVLFPLGAGALASAIGLQPLFLLSAILSVAAFAWFIQKVKEPRGAIA